MSKNILIIGAGRSSGVMINYLLQEAKANKLYIHVADYDLSLAKKKIGNSKFGNALKLDTNDEIALDTAIKNTDIVISMLPASMHIPVAKACLKNKKHLLTASYVSPEMQELHDKVKNEKLLFLNECGLDPGIDHLSAMEIIDNLHAQKAKITSFKSYCGGLVSPKSNDNPWGYKFSWNPMNVVLAGQATAKYLLNNKITYTNYYNLYRKSEAVNISQVGKYDAYPNRDSVSYKTAYGLSNVNTMIRGTLRQANYCAAWHVLVQLGLTDHSFTINNTNKLTIAEFTNSFLGNEKLNDFIKLHTSTKNYTQVKKQIDYLNLASNKKFKQESATPAQLLKEILIDKWKLKSKDTDRIIMYHEFEYTLLNKKYQLQSSLVLDGKSNTHTAMAETVGMPLAIATLALLKGEFKGEYGVQIPTKKVYYKMLLAKLNEICNIKFKEITKEIK